MPLSYTYDGTLTATSQLYRTRRLLGDVGALLNDDGSQVWLLADEEIIGYIGNDSANLASVNEGIALCADALAIQFAQEPTMVRDEAGVMVNWSDRVKQWNRLSDNLRKGIANSTTTVPVGVPVSMRLNSPLDVGNLRP